VPEILALAPYLPGTAGGQRTSIESWAPALAAHGINVHLVPFESDALHRILYQRHQTVSKGAEMIRCYRESIRLVGDLSGYDAVFVHREAALVGPEILERWVVRRGLPLIYGLDDPLFVPYRSPANGALSRLKFPGKVARLCSLATCVVVNSSPLRAFAEKHNDNVWNVPSLVDEASYLPQPRQSGAPICVGWSGSSTSAANLDILVAPLHELAQRVPFELNLIGVRQRSLGSVACTSKPWSPDTEVEDLRTFDVGLVPMSDHPWNEWKFSLKLAQYMALGIPSVCSPTRSITEQIQHGVTGFLASTPDDWVRYLAALIKDAELRRHMGAAAAEYAHRHFTVSANRDGIVGAFRSVLERSPAGQR